MKIVSFKVAKAIKEAGYPQGDENSGLMDVYPLEDHDDNFVPYTRRGKLSTNYACRTFRILSVIPFVVAPTYLDVWLWLWREKNIKIQNEFDSANIWPIGVSISYYADPEEAIEEAIEYLADNDLIK